jgi:hypothetical protein
MMRFMREPEARKGLKKSFWGGLGLEVGTPRLASCYPRGPWVGSRLVEDTNAKRGGGGGSTSTAKASGTLHSKAIRCYRNILLVNTGYSDGIGSGSTSPVAGALANRSACPAALRKHDEMDAALRPAVPLALLQIRRLRHYSMLILHEVANFCHRHTSSPAFRMC